MSRRYKKLTQIRDAIISVEQNESKTVATSTEAFGLFGSKKGMRKPGENRTTAYKDFNKTYLDSSWLNKQTPASTVTIKEGRIAGFFGRHEVFPDLKKIKVLVDQLSKLDPDKDLPVILNDTALGVIKTAKPYDSDKIGKMLYMALNKAIASVLPTDLPGSYIKPSDVLDESAWKVSSVGEFKEEINAPSDIKLCAELVLSCYSLEEELTRPSVDIGDMLWEGYEYIKNASFKDEQSWNEFCDKARDELPHEEILALLKFIAKEVGNLGLLLDKYLYSTFNSNTTASTEGFLGDALSKLGSLFKSRTKLPSKDEVKKLQEVEIALKKTVLNEKWLKDAEFVEGLVSAQGILPELEFEGKFDTKDPVAFIRNAVRRTEAFGMDYSKEIAPYNKAISQIEDSLKREIIKIDKVTRDQKHKRDLWEKAFEKAISQVKKLKDPIEFVVRKRSVSLIGNETVTSDGEQVYCKRTKSSTDKLPAITRDQCREIAELWLEIQAIEQKVSEVSYFGFTDHSDGSKEWDLTSDLDGWHKFHELTYFQRIESKLEYYSPVLAIQKSLYATLTWFNRSVK